MDKKQLVNLVSARIGSSKSAAADIVDAVLEATQRALSSGDDVRIAGFGTFSVRKRQERRGRNPATGAEIVIPAANTVRFKSAAPLKQALSLPGDPVQPSLPGKPSYYAQRNSALSGDAAQPSLPARPRFRRETE